MQGGLADVWKENVMEKLEAGKIEYESAEEFLTSLRKEFGRGEEDIALAGDNRACSNGRSRKDECSGHKRTGAGCGDSS